MSNFKEVGRLTRDFEIVNVGNSSVCKSTLAYDSGRISKKDNTRKTNFINIELWVSSEKAVKFIQERGVKGALVIVSGNLEMDRYQAKDGTMRTVHKIDCDRFGGCKFVGYNNKKQDSDYTKKDNVNNAEFAPENEFNPYDDFQAVGGDEDIPF